MFVDVAKKQQKVFKNDLNSIYYLSKYKFNKIKKLSTEDVRIVFNNNSCEYITKKALNFWSKGGKNVNYNQYLATPKYIIACTGCKRVIQQSPYEKAVLKICRPYGFYKARNEYLQENGLFRENKQGIIKSIDAINPLKKVCLYHKQWNDDGGSQESDSNEIGELLKRIQKSNYNIILVCTGSYFTPERLKEINLFVENSLNKARIFTDREIQILINSGIIFLIILINVKKITRTIQYN